MESVVFSDQDGNGHAAFSDRLRRFAAISQGLSLSVEPFRPGLVEPDPDDGILRLRIDRFVLGRASLRQDR
jgi:hypothetical protein